MAARRAKHQQLVHNTKAETLHVKVASNAISQGGKQMSLSHATGVYTFTLAQPVKRILGISVALITAALRAQVTAASGTTVEISLFGYNNTTPTNGDFFVTVDTSNSSIDR